MLVVCVRVCTPTDQESFLERILLGNYSLSENANSLKKIHVEEPAKRPTSRISFLNLEFELPTILTFKPAAILVN